MQHPCRNRSPFIGSVSMSKAVARSESGQPMPRTVARRSADGALILSHAFLRLCHTGRVVTIPRSCRLPYTRVSRPGWLVADCAGQPAERKCFGPLAGVAGSEFHLGRFRIYLGLGTWPEFPSAQVCILHVSSWRRVRSSQRPPSELETWVRPNPWRWRFHAFCTASLRCSSSMNGELVGAEVAFGTAIRRSKKRCALAVAVSSLRHRLPRRRHGGGRRLAFSPSHGREGCVLVFGGGNFDTCTASFASTRLAAWRGSRLAHSRLL